MQRKECGHNKILEAEYGSHNPPRGKMFLLNDIIRYLIQHSSISARMSALTLSISVVLAPLLSMVIFIGKLYSPIVCLKKRRAAGKSRQALEGEQKIDGGAVAIDGMPKNTAIDQSPYNRLCRTNN
ncbi:hypothetical protein AAKU64_004263 [Undibacterium sp. GrIS 1.8]